MWDLLKNDKIFVPENPLIKFVEGVVEYRNKNFKSAVDIFSRSDIDKKDISRNMLKSNYIAKCYDQLGLYQKAYEYFEIANRISEELHNNNSDKKKFMNSIVKRTNFVSNFTNKITKKELNKNTNLDQDL